MNYFANLAVGLFECMSCAANVVLGGQFGETLSSRSYRCSWPLRHVIDVVFSPISKGKHCRGAYSAVRVASIRRAMWPERVEGSED